MYKKKSVFKWLFVLVIVLLAIAFLFYRKIMHYPTNFEQSDSFEYVSEPDKQEYEDRVSSEGSAQFFNYTQPEDEEVEIEDATDRIAQKPSEQLKYTKNMHPETFEHTTESIKPHVEQQNKKPRVSSSDQKKDKVAELKNASIENATKEIHLTSHIDKNSLGYKHWTGRYYPSKWILKFNGKTILTFNGKTFSPLAKTITLDPLKPLKVHFDFEFLGGRRHGWKEVVYKLDKNTDTLTLAFDWKDPKDYQILVTPAKAISTRHYNNHEKKK